MEKFITLIKKYFKDILRMIALKAMVLIYVIMGLLSREFGLGIGKFNDFFTICLFKDRIKIK